MFWEYVSYKSSVKANGFPFIYCSLHKLFSTLDILSRFEFRGEERRKISKDRSLEAQGWHLAHKTERTERVRGGGDIGASLKKREMMSEKTAWVPANVELDLPKTRTDHTHIRRHALHYIAMTYYLSLTSTSKSPHPFGLLLYI